MDNEKLAREIVKALFTNGFGEEATQMRLDKDGKYLGGWSQSGAYLQVMEVLAKLDGGNNKTIGE